MSYRWLFRILRSGGAESQQQKSTLPTPPNAEKTQTKRNGLDAFWRELHYKKQNIEFLHWINRNGKRNANAKINAEAAGMFHGALIAHVLMVI